MVFLWTNRFSLCLFFLVLSTGCSSSLKKVTNENAPTMKEVYKNYIGADDGAIEDRKVELMRRPAVVEEDLQLGLPPYPARLDHLYPRLPNPDLFMYVRPHAVGVTGAPIPAYITRFSMYERQPYSLPGETLESATIINDFNRRRLTEKSQGHDNNKKVSATRKQENH